MRKVFFWQDIAGDNKKFEPYRDQINRLISGEYKALSLEKLKYLSPTPIYSIRINREARILFTTFHGKICLLDVVLNHDYHKSKFLKKPGILNAFLGKRSSEEKSLPMRLKGNAAEDFEAYDRIEGIEVAAAGDIKNVALHNYQNQMVEFSEVQDNVLRSSLPLAISGPAGSGKSCVAMSMLINYVRENAGKEGAFPIVYATQSEKLVALMQAMWRENLAEELPPEAIIKFTTIKELYNEQIEEGWTLATSDIFSSWYNDYLYKIKSISKAGSKPSPILTQEKDDVWREFRIISGVSSKEEYLRLGEGQSTVTHELREVIFECNKAYIAHLEHNKLIEHELAILKPSDYKLAIIDEAQDLSYIQLKGLNSFANGQIVYMLGEHQILFDGLSRLAYLQQCFYRSPRPLSLIQLNGTYRSAQAILNVAMTMVKFKYGATGGATDKGEIIELRATGDMAGVEGRTLWLNPENKAELFSLNAEAISGKLAVIRWSEKGAKEARTAIGTPLVFLPAEVKGQEFDTAVLWDPFASAECFKACEKLKAHASGASAAGGKGHRAKKGESDTSFLPYFNELITAITRARKKLVIVHLGDYHKIEPLLEELYKVFPSLNDILCPKKASATMVAKPFGFAAEETLVPAAVDEVHWEEMALRQLILGNEKQAREIFKSTLKRPDADYEAFAIKHRLITSSGKDLKVSAAASMPAKEKLLSLDEIQRRETIRGKGKLHHADKFTFLKSHLELDPSCITNHYVRAWLKDSLNVNDPSFPLEKTLLYWLVTTDAGISVLRLIVYNAAANSDLLNIIPPKAWVNKANIGEKSENQVLLHLLVSSDSGCEILHLLLTKHPKFIDKIPDDAWITAPTTGEKANISALLELQVSVSGRKVLELLLAKKPKYKSLLPISKPVTVKDTTASSELKSAPVPAPSDNIRINVSDEFNTFKHVISLTENTSILDVKNILAKTLSCQVEDIILTNGDPGLNDSTTLKALKESRNKALLNLTVKAKAMPPAQLEESLTPSILLWSAIMRRRTGAIIPLRDIEAFRKAKVFDADFPEPTGIKPKDSKGIPTAISVAELMSFLRDSLRYLGYGGTLNVDLVNKVWGLENKLVISFGEFKRLMELFSLPTSHMIFSAAVRAAFLAAKKPVDGYLDKDQFTIMQHLAQALLPLATDILADAINSSCYGGANGAWAGFLPQEQVIECLKADGRVGAFMISLNGTGQLVISYLTSPEGDEDIGPRIKHEILEINYSVPEGPLDRFILGGINYPSVAEALANSKLFLKHPCVIGALSTVFGSVSSAKVATPKQIPSPWVQFDNLMQAQCGQIDRREFNSEYRSLIELASQRVYLAKDKLDDRDYLKIYNSSAMSRLMVSGDPSNNLRKYAFDGYHGILNYPNTCERLKDKLPGTYLLRASQSKKGSILLSFVSAARITLQCIINPSTEEPGKVVIELSSGSNKTFDSLLDAILTLSSPASEGMVPMLQNALPQYAPISANAMVVPWQELPLYPEPTCEASVGPDSSPVLPMDELPTNSSLISRSSSRLTIAADLEKIIDLVWKSLIDTKIPTIRYTIGGGAATTAPQLRPDTMPFADSVTALPVPALLSQGIFRGNLQALESDLTQLTTALAQLKTAVSATHK